MVTLREPGTLYFTRLKGVCDSTRNCTLLQIDSLHHDMKISVSQHELSCLHCRDDIFLLDVHFAENLNWGGKKIHCGLKNTDKRLNRSDPPPTQTHIYILYEGCIAIYDINL